MIVNDVDKTRNYEGLANAIITQAANDYRNALFHNEKRHLREIERFFESEWFRTLTKLDGRTIMNRIRKECNYESITRKRNT